MPPLEQNGMRSEPAAAVFAWVSAHPRATLYTTSVSEAEIRGLDDEVLDGAEAELSRLAERQGGQLARMSAKAPTRSHTDLVAALEGACGGLGLAHRRMASGAGHDAMVIGEFIPQAMLFVPSEGGVSHSPEEFTSPDRCVDGARVLLAALLDLDARLDV